MAAEPVFKEIYIEASEYPGTTSLDCQGERGSRPLASCANGRFLQFLLCLGTPDICTYQPRISVRRADCKRPFASPQISGKITPSPENIVLLEFETAFGEALKNQRSLRFPGASIGRRYFLQMVEDLFWLLTRKTVGYGRLFVHHLHGTVFRISPRLYYPPQLRPWPGDFDAQNRLGLLSHTAALAGGRSIREQILPGRQVILRSAQNDSESCAANPELP